MSLNPVIRCCDPSCDWWYCTQCDQEKDGPQPLSQRPKTPLPTPYDNHLRITVVSVFDFIQVITDLFASAVTNKTKK